MKEEDSINATFGFIRRKGSIIFFLPSFVVLAVIGWLIVPSSGNNPPSDEIKPPSNENRQQKSATIFLCNSKLRPVTDVILINPKGEIEVPNKFGIVQLPDSWIGVFVSVRDKETKSEVHRFLMEDNTHRVIISK